MNISLCDFKKAIDEVYNIIIQPIGSLHKSAAVKNCRERLGIGDDLGFRELYGMVCGNGKERGRVYTPIEIADYIIENTISSEDIIKNPHLRILDPACGCGNIIIPCYYHLKKIYTENLSEINKKHGLDLSSDDLDAHIVKNNLFGFDLDSAAVKALQTDMFCISGYICHENFQIKDYLIDEINGRFDIILGNPPYVGHKTVDKSYSKMLREKYRDTYSDKGDISYCFFQKSLGLLEKSGKLTFITSRYFMEAPSGKALRKLLRSSGALLRVVDFYGMRPFKGIGIDPAIIFIDCGKKENGFFEVSRYGCKTPFFFKKDNLGDDGWMLKTEEELALIKKIRGKCGKSLGDIAESYQGIITGYDKAFVLTREEAEEAKIEPMLLKPWIKSSQIEKGCVKSYKQLLIYSDMIESEDEYPNAIRHISKYKERLCLRRECKTGARKWYMLQWGRKQDVFDREKIVFPYKSDTNRFAIDRGSYFSADVYCLVLNENAKIDISKLAMILNSSVYEFYFKSFAKKLGKDQYEYYPNSLMKLMIPEELPEDVKNDDDLLEFFGLAPQEASLIKK